MTLHARSVPVPADALRIARALRDEDGLAFLWTATGRGPSYVACWPVEISAALDPEPGLIAVPSRNAHADVPRWIGLLPYECRRDLERPAFTPKPDRRETPQLTAPMWCRYGAVVVVTDRVLIVGDDSRQVDRLAIRLRGGAGSEAAPIRVEPVGIGEPDSVHRARVERAKALIVEGEIYQVNLARRFEFSLEGNAVDLVERFVRRARAPYAFGFEHAGLKVAASSPELFLSVDAAGRIVTAPIKGTRPRGADAKSDRELLRALEVDPKESAELAMVVDVERNDLGRISRTGTVRVVGRPRIETFGSVHHRIATVAARLRPDVTRGDVLALTLPSGSVTGAPKIRAMEVIAELEAARRGLYTGAFGYLAHDGSLRLAMAIRTLTARAGRAHYHAGGGIVLDSDPDREVAETHWKAAQLRDLLHTDDAAPRRNRGQNFAEAVREG